MTGTPPRDRRRRWRDYAGFRIGVAGVVGVVVGLTVGFGGYWRVAAPAGWVAAGLFYVGWIWLHVGRFDAEQTRTHALDDDPSREVTGVVVVVASLASLTGVVFLLIAHSGTDLAAGLGALSVLVAWGVVHTVFALRYAAMYYGDPEGGIAFNTRDGPDRPRYLDFAYLAFSIGMTFQVSDTNLQTTRLRATALLQSFLGFVLGALILGVTVNLVASLTFH